MKKRLISLLLVIGMLAGMLTIGIAKEYSFADDDGTGTWTWAGEYIYDCYEEGIINGYEDGTYLPDGKLTRAEAAKIIAVTYGLSSDASVSSFSDVSADHWALPYIEACVEAGIINGYEDGTFLPGQNVTRAEMAKMIAAASGLSSGASAGTFSDVLASHWALPYIEACYEAGIITGYEDGTFLPGNNITRAEAATIISRVLGLMNADEDSDDDTNDDSDGEEDGDSPALSDLDADEIYFSVDTDNTVTFTVTAENTDDTIVLYDEDSAVGTMHDDGENGDETAGDGIYTVQLAVNISSDTNVTQTYYAAAGDCESETVSLYFFPTPTEETLEVYEEEYEEVTTSLEEIRDLYKDDTGYVPADSVEELFDAVEEYLAELLEDGIIVRYVVDEESAYLKLASGISLCFEQIYEDTLGSGSDVTLTFASYLPSSINGEESASETIEQLAETFASSAVTYSGSQITLELIASIGSNQVIFWLGHGGYSPEKGNTLATGEELDINDLLYDGDSLYRNYYLSDSITGGISDGETTYHVSITSKFIDLYCGDLSNDLIIISACHSGQLEEDGSSKIPDSLIQKGAAAVVGFSDTTNTRYARLIGTYTLELMGEINDDTGDYYTLSEALSAAKEKYGDNDSDYFWTLWFGHDSEPLIFGGTDAENYRLADYSVTDEEEQEENTLTNADIPDDAVEYNGHYYLAVETSLDWDDAIAYSESLGGYLASITSEEENEFLYEYVTSSGYYSAYFGLYDYDGNDNWVWLSGETVSYTNWHSGEPNSSNERYGMFYSSYRDGTWNDGTFTESGRVIIIEWG